MALARPRRDWGRLLLATLGGLVLGSTWYAINLAETGKLDGGLAESADQKVDLALPAITTEPLRLLLDLLDLSGARRPHDLVYLAVGVCLAAIGLTLARRSLRLAVGVALTGAFVATIPAAFREVSGIAHDLVFRTWVFVDRPETAPFELGWGMNVAADPALSWYGPLGVLLLVVGAAVVMRLRMLGRLPTAAVGLALAPLMLAATIPRATIFRSWPVLLGFLLSRARRSSSSAGRLSSSALQRSSLTARRCTGTSAAS